MYSRPIGIPDWEGSNGAGRKTLFAFNILLCIFTFVQMMRILLGIRAKKFLPGGPLLVGKSILLMLAFGGLASMAADAAAVVWYLPFAYPKWLGILGILGFGIASCVVGILVILSTAKPEKARSYFPLVVAINFFLCLIVGLIAIGIGTSKSVGSILLIALRCIFPLAVILKLIFTPTNYVIFKASGIVYNILLCAYVVAYCFAGPHTVVERAFEFLCIFSLAMITQYFHSWLRNPDNIASTREFFEKCDRKQQTYDVPSSSVLLIDENGSLLVV